MSFKPVWASFVALALLAAPAAAQQTEVPELKSEENEVFAPEHLEKAAEMMRLTNASAGYDDILPIVMQQTITLFTRSNPGIATTIDEVTTGVAVEMAKRRPELSRTLEKVWARRFTEAELDELIAFFSSEIGSKFVEITPVITALSVGASKQWSDEVSQAMVAQVRAAMKERGYDL